MGRTSSSCFHPIFSSHGLSELKEIFQHVHLADKELRHKQGMSGGKLLQGSWDSGSHLFPWYTLPPPTSVHPQAGYSGVYLSIPRFCVNANGSTTYTHYNYMEAFQWNLNFKIWKLFLLVSSLLCSYLCCLSSQLNVGWLQIFLQQYKVPETKETISLTCIHILHLPKYLL